MNVHVRGIDPVVRQELRVAAVRRDLKKGDRLVFLRDDGWHGSIIGADVLRVNRVTVTVRDDQGRVSRVDPRLIDHKMSEIEKAESQDWFPSGGSLPPLGNARALSAD
jgi:hypothetical protein